jgi:hypothetical protein
MMIRRQNSKEGAFHRIHTTVVDITAGAGLLIASGAYIYHEISSVLKTEHGRDKVFVDRSSSVSCP